MLEAVESSVNGGCSQLQSCGDSSEEELSVLPRHTKVVVTGNNRTKSVLVGLRGCDDVTGRLSLGREAVEGGARGAEVSDGSERERLVFELLRHGADDGAEAVVVVLRGVMWICT